MKYLTIKNGIWYFRYQLPFLYRSYFNNRREIKKSLRTSDKMLASVRALKLEVTIKEHLMTIKQKLSQEAAHELIKVQAGSTIAKIECALDPMGELSQAYMNTYLKRIEADPDLTSDQIAAYMSPIENLFDKSSSVESLTKDILEDFEISVTNPTSWTTRLALSQVFKLAQHAQQTLSNNDIDATHKVLKQLELIMSPNNHGEDVTDSMISEPQVQVMAPALDSRTLKELFEEYAKEQKIVVRERTLDLMKAKAYYMSELLNDCPAHSIDRKKAVELRDLLLALPSNVRKKADFKGLSLKAAIEKNKQLEVPHKTLNANTVKDYFEKVSSLYIWAMRHKYLTHNPFEGIKTQHKAEQKKANEERHPFNDEHLTRLFSTSIFTDNEMRHSFYYWLPIIALYTGARQNEIAQLFKGNIVKIGEIWCFNFKKIHPTQNFKNDASERITPIHHKLIELGFIEFVDTCEERIFETGLPYHKKLGYGKEASRWFNEKYKKKLGIETNCGLAFHSFRHSVLDFYKQSTTAEERFAQGIVGHQHDSISFDRYGDDFRPQVLKPYVDMLNWDFINPQPFDIEKHIARTSKEKLRKSRRDSRAAAKL
jgi:integrase